MLLFTFKCVPCIKEEGGSGVGIQENRRVCTEKQNQPMHSHLATLIQFGGSCEVKLFFHRTETDERGPPVSVSGRLLPVAKTQ